MAAEHLAITSGAFDTMKTLIVAGTASQAKLTAERVIADHVVITPSASGATLAFSDGGAEFPIPTTGITLTASENKNFDLSTFWIKGNTIDFNILYRSTGRIPA